MLRIIINIFINIPNSDKIYLQRLRSKVSNPQPSSYCLSLGPPAYCFVQAYVTKSKVSLPPPFSYCTSLGPPAYCFVQAYVTTVSMV